MLAQHHGTTPAGAALQAVLRRAPKVLPASVALELQRVGTDAVLGDNQDLHVIALQACGTREGWVGRQSKWWEERTVERAPSHRKIVDGRRC